MVKVTIILLAFFICVQYFVIRNNWIFKQRIRLITEKWDTYEQYLNCKEMLIRFWIWDIEKLKKKETKNV